MKEPLVLLDSVIENEALHLGHLLETAYSVLFQMNANDLQHRSSVCIGG